MLLISSKSYVGTSWCFHFHQICKHCLVNIFSWIFKIKLRKSILPTPESCILSKCNWIYTMLCVLFKLFKMSLIFTNFVWVCHGKHRYLFLQLFMNTLAIQCTTLLFDVLVLLRAFKEFGCQFLTNIFLKH